MTVHCYPVANKKKAFDICQAFADGCGGKVVTEGPLRDGPAVFYGVNPSNADVWQQVRQEKRDYYYIDNSYFDSARGTYFRVTKNAIQHSGVGISECARFRSLGLTVKPWRTRGKQIVVCPQSVPFMRDVAGYYEDWTARTVSALHNLSDRQILLRLWSPDKGKLASTLLEDLAGAHALVTWSSAAAVTAILNGIPAVVDRSSAAAPMAGNIESIEDLPTPDGRTEWAGVLADNQWMLREMAAGMTWAQIGG